MRYPGMYFVVGCLCVSFSASAVTGSSPSAITHLETVSPALQAVTATGEKNLSATFSEPMLAPGVIVPGNYAVSGLGAGTLAPLPTTVSGGPASVTLDWASGEMRHGVPLTLTASGVRDALGNPINPAANSASCNGLGTAPVFSDLTVMPPEAAAGDTVTITFSVSETLQADPEVTVNGHPATAPYGKADGYSYEYEVQESDAPGMAQIEISGADLAGNLGALSDNDALEIIQDVEGLPLPGWPWAALLLLALGMVFLVRRRFIVEAPSQALCEKMGLFPPRTSKSLDGSLHRDTLSGLQKTNPARGGNCPAFFGPDASARKNRGLTQAQRSGDVSVPGFCPDTDARKKFGTASGVLQSLVQWLKRLRAPEAVPFFALLLACSWAFADAPVVSNVVLTQSPNATSTQVDIYYDLVAPNGPCAITVTLSRDGGADGYSYPVTSVTGDLANVTTGTGKHIVWDLRADYPEENLPNARILVTADDAAVLVRYYRDDDEDLFGQSGDSQLLAAPAAPYTAIQGADCDDTDPNVNPNMTEVCCNGKDDDCDGTTDNAATCTFTLTYLAGAGGAISGTTPQSLYNCEMGTEVTAVPDPGYHFVDWSDGVMTASRTDGTLTAPLTVTANFALNTYTLTYLAGPGGAISGPTPQTVNHGASGTAVTAVAQGGFAFTQWSDGVLTAARTNTNVTTNITVTAGFAPLVEYFRDDDNDTWGLDGDSVWAVGPAVPYTASIPGDCDDTDANINPGAPEVCCNGKDDDCDGTTDNAAACTFTLTYLAGTGGTISGTTPQDLYNCEMGTEVTAVPDTGYHFVNWSDGVLTAARTDGNLTTDLTVTANFAPNTYTLTYLAGANGSISGPTPQTVNHGANGTAVSAVGSGSYVFNQWSDGSTQNPRTDTNVTANITVTANFVNAAPVVSSFAINSGGSTTMPLAVTLNNTATNSPTEYMASESATFSGASWAAYGTEPGFTLSFGVGTRTVYFKARNGKGESPVVSDTIFIVPNTVSVGAGTFSMGRTSAGDDNTYGGTDELPVHSVTLGAYQLGKYEVTNKEYCDVLNWARAQGYLYSDAAGTPWAGTGSIYAGGAGFLYLIVSFASTDCNIQYSGGVFSSKTKVGLPGSTNYSMDTHPMVCVSWYGSVAYCNWLSQWQGLTRCYNMSAANWPLTVAPPTSGGYRLPTEAEWERAAAWNGTKHWIYSFMSDTNPSGTANRCNDGNSGTYDNPLGLTTIPYTSPVGWFNGTNVNPNGSVTTVNSPSPVGAYDLSGNVWEWCHDWYSSTYYSGGSMTNPTGPATGSIRVVRGGGWRTYFYDCRSAGRFISTPSSSSDFFGFRLSRS